MALQFSHTPQGSVVGPPVPVRPDAVQPLGDDARRRRLARAANAGQHEGLGDAVGREGVLQGPHHGVLSDQVGKGLGPVLARQNLVAGVGGVAH
jgi:hypothetical protein